MLEFYGVRPELGFRFVHSYFRPLPEWAPLVHASEAVFTSGRRGNEHLHQVAEITYVARGLGSRVVNGRVHALQARDFHLTLPGELHRPIADRADPFRYFTLGIDLDRLPTAQIPEVVEAMAAVRPLGARVVRGGAGCERPCRGRIEELARLESGRRHRRLGIVMVQSLVTEIVVRFVEAALAGERRELEPEPVRPEIQELLTRLRERLANPPSISAMAASVGLSRGHFITTFRREVGRTPVEFMTALRIGEASRRLEYTDEPVSGIARSLGFSSARYFCAVFRKAKGCPPSAWQRRHGL